MKLRSHYGELFCALLLIAAVEAFLLPAGGLSMALLGVGVAAVGVAAWAELRRVAMAPAPPAAPVAPAPVSPPVPHRGPTAFPTPTPTPAAPTQPAPPRSVAFPEPPRFGSSRAHQAPWQLPTVPSGAGVLADQAVLGGLAVRAASVVGASHRCEEPAGPRQDSYSLGRDRSGRHLVLAVTDGVSSSRHSDLGATLAARSAVQTIVQQLNAGSPVDRLDAPAVFGQVADRIRGSAQQQQARPVDYSCVAVVAVIATEPDANGEYRCWIGWLGDVTVWSRRKDAWRPMVGDFKGDTADGDETGEIHESLPGEPEAARMRVFYLPAGCTVAFVTDGVGDALRMAPEVGRYLAGRWHTAPTAASFLNDLSFEIPRQLDDRTAVVVWTGQPGPA
jgi:Protein phosphatase 2C